MNEHDRVGLIREQDHGTLKEWNDISDEIPWSDNSWVSTEEFIKPNKGMGV